MAVPQRGKDICRMCGERYAGLDSVDIYEPRGLQPAYCILMQDLLSLNPSRGDLKPERLGLTCAKLLDDWAKFRNKCYDTQKILAIQLQKQQSKEEPTASGSGLSHNTTADGSGTSSEASSSRVPTAGLASVASKISLKRTLSSSSEDEDSEEESTHHSTRRRKHDKKR